MLRVGKVTEDGQAMSRTMAPRGRGRRLSMKSAYKRVRKAGFGTASLKAVPLDGTK